MLEALKAFPEGVSGNYREFERKRGGWGAKRDKRGKRKKRALYRGVTVCRTEALGVRKRITPSGKARKKRNANDHPFKHIAGSEATGPGRLE